MKTTSKSIRNVALFAILTTTCIFFNSCKKGDQPAPKVPTTTNVTTQDESIKSINLIGLRSDSGFSYKIGYDLTDIGDSNALPTISKLKLFENGVELGPAHSNHHDIRSFGLGQFSHWGNTLYFSTSDNSDPLKNGRKYTYTLK
ncbi:hypothetical protein SAMN05216464_102494 [Mucilaginibacter pineti]|uniref:Uncharacterized protein n=1 Tax=Mucilaginibacter pineti TaxID=1391627 RepID=A0A1G6XD85_9SPHI|nr:hypothetical protein [Mucilaginibacter pineti]SDD76128.1 hypothetical protein SAMN05216464_102494 [Mucilaginibacter pineti]